MGGDRGNGIFPCPAVSVHKLWVCTLWYVFAKPKRGLIHSSIPPVLLQYKHNQTAQIQPALLTDSTSGTRTLPPPITNTRAVLGLWMHRNTRFIYMGKRVAYTDVCEKPNALIHLSRTTVQIISLDTLILIHNLQCYGPYTNYCCSQQQMNINITVPSIIARGSN